MVADFTIKLSSPIASIKTPSTNTRSKAKLLLGSRMKQMSWLKQPSSTTSSKSSIRSDRRHLIMLRDPLRTRVDLRWVCRKGCFRRRQREKLNVFRRMWLWVAMSLRDLGRLVDLSRNRNSWSLRRSGTTPNISRQSNNLRSSTYPLKSRLISRTVSINFLTLYTINNHPSSINHLQLVNQRSLIRSSILRRSSPITLLCLGMGELVRGGGLQLQSDTDHQVSDSQAMRMLSLDDEILSHDLRWTRTLWSGRKWRWGRLELLQWQESLLLELLLRESHLHHRSQTPRSSVTMRSLWPTRWRMWSCRCLTRGRRGVGWKGGGIRSRSTWQSNNPSRNPSSISSINLWDVRYRWWWHRDDRKRKEWEWQEDHQREPWWGLNIIDRCPRSRSRPLRI